MAMAAVTPSIGSLSAYCSSRNAIGTLAHLRKAGIYSKVRRTSYSSLKFVDVLPLSFHRQWKRVDNGTVCSASAPAATEKEEEATQFVLMQERIEFLKRDLVHLFDDQGIDKSMYDKQVEFRDPITRYNSLDGYLFNIQMLRVILNPTLELHAIQQTGTWTITYRWTMTMTFLLLPWRPVVVVTGTSEIGVNPATGKFCSHTDQWDAVQNNDYLSLEAVAEIVKQLQYFKTPDLETPKYQVLKRTAGYEVRQYESFLVAETTSDQIDGSKNFNDVAGYLFGKNSTGERMKMTTPVFTQIAERGIQLQFVLPLQSLLTKVPAPLSKKVQVREIKKSFAAVVKFNGKTTEELVFEKEKILRNAIIKDGLTPGTGFLLARYNDPGRTWPILRRNEVIIRLESFEFTASDLQHLRKI